MNEGRVIKDGNGERWVIPSGMEFVGYSSHGIPVVSGPLGLMQAIRLGDRLGDAATE